jgi:hypothetical protein
MSTFRFAMLGDPANFPLRHLSGFGHIPEILASSNGPSPQRPALNGLEQRLLEPRLDTRSH